MSSRAGLPPLPRDAAPAGHAGDTSGAQKLVYQHSPSHLRRANRSPPQPEQQLPAAGCSDTRLLRFRIERGSSGRGRKRRCSPGNRPARSPRRHGLPARDPPAPPCPRTCAAGLPAALGAGGEVGCAVPAGGHHRSPRRLLLVLHGLDGFQPPRVLVALVVGFRLVLGRERRGRPRRCCGRTDGRTQGGRVTGQPWATAARTRFQCCHLPW